MIDLLRYQVRTGAHLLAIAVETAGKATIEVCTEDTPTVTLGGEVDFESAPLLRESIYRLAHGGHKDVYLRCPDVSFIDSSGISALVNAARVLSVTGGGLHLQEITKQLRHALEISGFLPLFIVDGLKIASTQDASRTVTRIWQSTSFSIPALADLDGTIRHRIMDVARTMPFSDEELEDIQLATGEAVANAYRHGCPDREHDRISVRCIGDESQLLIEISNPGPPFDPNSVPPPDPANPREGGMGIFFMRAAMDSVDYIFDEHGTTVRMTKLLKNHNGGTGDNHTNVY